MFHVKQRKKRVAQANPFFAEKVGAIGEDWEGRGENQGRLKYFEVQNIARGRGEKDHLVVGSCLRFGEVGAPFDLRGRGAGRV